MKSAQLFIDTTINGAVVGLKLSSSKVLDFSVQTDEVTDSARLLPVMVADALNTLNLSAKDIHSVVVSQGPGSFTGIRVGMSYAYGLVFGLESSGSDVKIIGVSSLAALRASLEQKCCSSLVLFLPSTRTTGYAVGQVGDSVEIEAVDLSSGVNPAWSGKNWALIGQWPQLEELLKVKNEVFKLQLSLKEASMMAINAMVEISSAEVGKTDYVSGHWDSKSFPNAIYLRKSSVEENQKKLV